MGEYAGYLTVLQLQLASVWTPIAQIRDLDGPSEESDTIEVSHRDSRYRRFVAGMRDGGEVSFDLIFDPDETTHDPLISGGLRDLLKEGTEGNFRVIFPGQNSDTTTAEFGAFVTSYKPSAPLEDAQTAEVTVKVNGEPEWSHS